MSTSSSKKEKRKMNTIQSILLFSKILNSFSSRVMSRIAQNTTH